MGWLVVCVSHGGPGTGNVANEERGAQVRAISVFQPPSIGNRVHLHFLFSPPRHSLSHSLTHTHTHTHTRRKKEGGHHFGDGPRNKTPKQNPEREKNIYIYIRGGIQTSKKANKSLTCEPKRPRRGHLWLYLFA